jgi:cytochrome b subunit of formate dehydrogenase
MLAGCVAVSVATGSEPPLYEVDNRRCLSCHGQPRIAQDSPEDRWTMVAPTPGEPVPTPEEIARAPETRPELYVDYDSVYRFSVHGQTSCVSCHGDCEQLPHPRRVAPADCASCHAQEQGDYAVSVHGRAVSGGDEKAASCSSCHGTHDILSAKNPQSRTYKFQLPYTCAECHSNKELMEEEDVSRPLAAKHYLDSMHGKALMVDGLVVAPSCNDCHGVHKILPTDDERSLVNRVNVPDTCGRCHSGIEVVYNKSIHGQKLAEGEDEAPVCTTCHTAHEINRPGEVAFKLSSDERCGQCHEDRLHRYRETFHGKAMALGLAGVAACYDCHGHHDIVPTDDPASHLYGENKLETCRKCHPKASKGFTSYLAHADHTDRKHYPALYWTFLFMTTIVLSTFAFFGIHTLLWLVRSLALYFNDREAFKEAKIKAIKDDDEFVRFRPIERFLHGLVVSSFLLLVATGMPLKFYEAGWAKWMVSFIGGLKVAGVLHRVGALITFTYFAIHLSSLAANVVRKRGMFKNPKSGRYNPMRLLRYAFGPDMPLPNLHDIKDMWAHQKWFFGRGPRPQFDRWTYWEKFDYFAVFWGVAIIGLSGLVMWFPEAFTRVLPGWLINISLIVHSDEALLAAGFIFTFHFFNVHFRIEKFPMDPVIFSGRISKTEMLHERKRWYDRMVAEGTLDAHRVRDEWWQWKRLIHPLGFLAFGIGIVLLILIFYALGTRLMGGVP